MNRAAGTAGRLLGVGPLLLIAYAASAGAWIGSPPAVDAIDARTRSQDSPTEDRSPTSDEVHELIRALAADEPDPVALQTAYDVFLGLHDAFRIEDARLLAEAMYAEQPATWSAFCLEGIARRSGDAERAEAVLTEQLGRVLGGQERIDLLERRAIARGGAGDALGSRKDLARALAAGGTDACQILGLAALEARRHTEARQLFRILLERADRGPDDQEPPAWALRGWALSLVKR